MDRASLRKLVVGTLEAERAPGGELSVVFVGDRAMRRMNRDYRGVDTTTDVLSFSYVGDDHTGGALGEVFVSPAAAETCAPREMARLVVHGLLHVLGYDHDTPASRRRMFHRQERYLERHFDGAARC